jgi:hypothetical protein
MSRKMSRKRNRPEVVERHQQLLDEVLIRKGLAHRPLVELFEMPGRRGVSHSGGIPAFSDEGWLLSMDYNVRSGQELSDEAEARIDRILAALA